MESKILPKTSIEDIRPEIPVLKLHKCWGTSYSAKTCAKNTKINEVQVIEEVPCAEEKEASDQDSKISSHTPAEYYLIENIIGLSVVTEVNTHLPHYIEYCCNLINIQDSRMCKTKPAGESGITSVLLNDIEVKFNLDTL
ncbi:hypothetical protein O181_012514 [Austropuccinia psidii MF-1]|uniref:Uncharacterized protein n=1 Tax=Austropuccinia psidii MF-1 TaxID=1389203 RepID=A0A9Q3BUS4_9BASI|nr:hypothetical protein [Austropuccinia psidii MF-1]